MVVAGRISGNTLNDSLAAQEPALALRVREEQAADLLFCLELFTSTRIAELEALPWSTEQKAAFCKQQFEAQHQHYVTNSPSAEFLVIEQRGERIGRLYIELTDNEFTLMEITLLPVLRGQGIGTAITAELLVQAHRLGRVMSLHVEPNNPARRLYERLGFTVKDEIAFYLFMTCSPPAVASSS